MRWLDGIINSMNMNLSKFQDIVKNKEAWCTDVHGVAESDMVYRLDNSKTKQMTSEDSYFLNGKQF